ncbi:hypothetical protein OCOL_001060 [Ordospora colligata]|uniref:Uncharacterized protein n=1 Tax=Ordospora colligata OC4 TaxID=1354746 RepID=A0A0B2ULN3_9MICR|nr:uncharacterized protein M896_041550 [Ordospora colligata OC4]KHN69957.1 hypothetical protein M896_041550 [Ordospora colligata OC4]TBU16127.1 hypothetical protein CWI41_041540 [Ordospora colligata]
MNTETSSKHSADISKGVEGEISKNEVDKAEVNKSEIIEGTNMHTQELSAAKPELKAENSVNAKSKNVSEEDKCITKTPEGVVIVSMDELMKYSDEKYSDKEGKKMIFGMWLNAEFKNELQRSKNNVKIFKILSIVSAAVIIGIVVYVIIKVVSSFLS